MGMCAQPITSEPLLLPRTVRVRLLLLIVIQAEGQNPDHRRVRLWGLRSTRLDDRFHHLFCETEEAETTCDGSGVQESQGHHRFRPRAKRYDLHHPT